VTSSDSKTFEAKEARGIAAILLIQLAAHFEPFEIRAKKMNLAQRKHPRKYHVTPCRVNGGSSSWLSELQTLPLPSLASLVFRSNAQHVMCLVSVSQDTEAYTRCLHFSP